MESSLVWFFFMFLNRFYDSRQEGRKSGWFPDGQRNQEWLKCFDPARLLSLFLESMTIIVWVSTQAQCVACESECAAEFGEVPSLWGKNRRSPGVPGIPPSQDTERWTVETTETMKRRAPTSSPPPPPPHLPFLLRFHLKQNKKESEWKRSVCNGFNPVLQSHSPMLWPMMENLVHRSAVGVISHIINRVQYLITESAFNLKETSLPPVSADSFNSSQMMAKTNKTFLIYLFFNVP